MSLKRTNSRPVSQSEGKQFTLLGPNRTLGQPLESRAQVICWVRASLGLRLSDLSLLQALPEAHFRTDKGLPSSLPFSELEIALEPFLRNCPLRIHSGVASKFLFRSVLRDNVPEADEFLESWDIHTHTYPTRDNVHRSKCPRSKSTKLTSQFHRFRPQIRKNETSEISPGQKCVFPNRNVKFKNFMHMEWSEEKFLQGIVGDKTSQRI